MPRRCAPGQECVRARQLAALAAPPVRLPDWPPELPRVFRLASAGVFLRRFGGSARGGATFIGARLRARGLAGNTGKVSVCTVPGSSRNFT